MKDGVQQLDRVLMMDPDKCTGCGICQLICSMLIHGEYNPTKSYIKLLRNKETGFNMAVLDINCRLCGACAEWCPRNALKFTTSAEATSIMKGSKVGDLPVPVVSRTMTC